MQFFKNLYNKWTGHEEAPFWDAYQSIMEFRILARLYHQQPDGTYILKSKNVEIVFDKLSNDALDFIMIVRLNKAAKHFNDVVFMKDGDFYFNVSFFRSIIQNTLTDDTEEFAFQLIDSTNLEWNLRIHFKTSTSLDRQHLEFFTDSLLRLIWVQKNQLPITQIKDNSYKNTLKFHKLAPLKLMDLVKQKAKLQGNKLDRNALLRPIARSEAEKEKIGDLLNYFITSTGSSVKQLFVASLFVLEEAQILCLREIVVVALNFASATDIRLEIYGADRSAILKQSVNEQLNYTLNRQDNYICWTFGEYNSSTVVYIKFDRPEGSEVMQLELSKARAKVQKLKDQDIKFIEKVLKQQFDQQQSAVQTQGCADPNLPINQHQDESVDIFFRNLTYANELIVLKHEKFDQAKIIKSESEVYVHFGHNLYHFEKQSLSLVQKLNGFYQQVLIQGKELLLLGENSEIVAHDCKSGQSTSLGSFQVQILEIALVPKHEKFRALILTEISVIGLTVENKLENVCNSQDPLSTIVISGDNSVIIGTKQGSVLIYDNVDLKQLVNTLPAWGDPIKGLQLSGDQKNLYLNYGSFILIQPLVSIENGLKQPLVNIPFPIKVEINPEDLILMGLFGQPNINCLIVDPKERVMSAFIQNVQFIWRLEYIRPGNVQGRSNLYEIRLLDESGLDQQFVDGLDIITVDDKIAIRKAKFE